MPLDQVDFVALSAADDWLPAFYERANGQYNTYGCCFKKRMVSLFKIRRMNQRTTTPSLPTLPTPQTSHNNDKRPKSRRQPMPTTIPPLPRKATRMNHRRSSIVIEEDRRMGIKTRTLPKKERCRTPQGYEVMSADGDQLFVVHHRGKTTLMVAVSKTYHHYTITLFDRLTRKNPKVPHHPKIADSAQCVKFLMGIGHRGCQ